MKHILSTLVLCLHILCVAQPHISEIFSLDTTITLEYYTKAGQQREITGTVFGDKIYFCKKSISENDSAVLRIYSVDLKSYEQAFFDVQFADLQLGTHYKTNYALLWIKGIAVSDRQLAIITQSAVFHDSFELLDFFTPDRTTAVKNAIGGYFHQGIFYIVEFENHEKYVLSTLDLQTGKKRQIRDFRFDSPFILQFKPERHFAITTDGIYHLETDHIGYTKYSLDGEKLYSVRRENYASWKAIPPEVAEKIMRQPYGTERIFEALSRNRENSFCTKIFPFSLNRNLIAYHSFDTAEQKETYNLLYACYDSLSQKLEVQPYRFDYHGDETLSGERYPFYIYKSEIVYSTTHANKFIQIIKGAPVSWAGLGAYSYSDSVNGYYKRHEPLLQLRIMTLKGGRVAQKDKFQISHDNCNNERNMEFKDFDGQPVNIDSLANPKLIIIVNNDLQCSSCEHTLYDFFSGINRGFEYGETTKLAVVFPEMCSFLMKRERVNEVTRYVKTPFTPLFATNTIAAGCVTAPAESAEYPKVILIDKRKGCCLKFSSSEIFSANRRQNVIDENFRETLLRFLRE